MPRRRKQLEAKLGADGRWHLWVTVGTKGNGRPDQRHISRDSQDECEDAAVELLDSVRATGVAPKSGKKPTVDSWLATYFDTIAPRKIDPTTIYGYRGKMRLYVSPVIGALRLERLAANPDRLDEVFLRMQKAGLADSTIRQTYRILSKALEVAYKRRLIQVNPCKLIDAPTAKAVEMTSLTEDAAVAILEATARRRNAARWSAGFALGLRQGEALGLRWSYVDLDTAEMRVWWQLHRRPWEHGCGAAPCGRKRGGSCPARTRTLRSGEIELSGGLILKAPKGKSKRTIPIPPELVEQLRQHREVQALERLMAGGAYAGHDLVFARPDGAPTDPREDWGEWKLLLALAGVPDARVHDARHTAATLLRVQGVELEVIQELLGHSSIVVTRGYEHVASAMVRKGVEALGKKLLRGQA